MANLIITVIAIALVAVASLMGAYYGGSAFLNNQSAANASTVLNEGQQLAGAWQAYLNDNLNTAPATLAALTTGNYLQSIPDAPAEAGGVGSTAIVVSLVGTHYYAYADMGHSSAPSVTDANASACLHVIKTATGGTPTAAQFTAKAPGAIASNANLGNGTFGCAITNAAITAYPGSAGNPPPSGDYVAEYKIE